ncbi:hypothetical protein [Gimesia algae]|uniref:Lipocalin-like domain-containing protein n=1 Tax=Gimesia algae TaxID=2527971 RepID=A0A517VE49_9PLAN|nr:hypothetical protein [Gimesia algae]QDT91288.1 hypothetical protein Pan161_29440 [Gimesia algae]
MKTFFLKLKQARFRSALAGLAGVLVLLLTFFLTTDNQPPLSPAERLLVGEWYHAPAESTRIFHADRTFETSGRQFAGTWNIKEGRLSITYWQPYELPRSLSLTSLGLSLKSVQRSREKYTYGWEISFSDKGQRLSLSHPIDEHHPDGKWWWNRKTAP